MALPYKPWKMLRPTGAASTTRANVGRDALIPPDLAAAQTPAGGINPSPTNHGGPMANQETANLAL